ncbi:MAG: hypothetical protein PVG92_02830 [Holophagae bacterium]|jgi:hypothetical protein
MTAHQLATMSEKLESLQTQGFGLPDELQGAILPASEMIRRDRLRIREEPLPTSSTGLDRLLAGGLPKGRMVEYVGRGSCGRFASLLAALRAVTGAGEVAALVDQGEQLDPQSAAALGVDLERVLWVRPRQTGDSLAAAELLLHTGFPLVALDLGLPPVRGRAPLAAWLRLSRAAATHGAVVLVGTPYRLSGCAAAAVVAGGRSRGRWSGGGQSARLLNGLEGRLFVNKRLGHADLGDAPVVLTVPEVNFENSEFGIRNSELLPAHPETPSSSATPNERKTNHVRVI